MCVFFQRNPVHEWDFLPVRAGAQWMDGVDSVCCPGRFTHICHRQTHTSTSQPFRSMAHLSFPLFTVCMTVPNTVWLRLFYMHILSSYTEEASVQWLNEVREEFDWTGLAHLLLWIKAQQKIVVTYLHWREAELFSQEKATHWNSCTSWTREGWDRIANQVECIDFFFTFLELLYTKQTKTKSELMPT